MNKHRRPDMTTNRRQRRVRGRFNRGIQRIFSSFFSNDIRYHAFVEGEKDTLYDEWRTEPSYADPVCLTGQVNATPRPGDTEVQEERYDTVFRVTLKSFQRAGVPVEDRDWHGSILKGLITYQDVVYEIVRINPITYIADMNMTFNVFCRERVGFGNGEPETDQNG